MKTLTLLRHAKSSWKQPDLTDFDRPLNDRGQTDAPETGRRLARRGFKPKRIVSSTAVRARATAEAVADALGFPRAEIAWEPHIYEASSDRLLAVLRAQPDDADSLLLVGHNPGMTQFANALADDRLDNIPTAGAYTLHLPVAHWRDAAYGSGSRIAFDTPKNPDSD